MELQSCVTLCFMFVYTLSTVVAQDSLPTVNLRYSIHQASFNVCSFQKVRSTFIGSSEPYTFTDSECSVGCLDLIFGHKEAHPI